MSDITPMATVPSEVNYGRIRANFVAFIADDNGNVLEEVPLEGNVILTPTVGVLRFPSTSPPRTAVIQTLQCPVIGGILYPPGTPLGGPFPSQTGVAAVASDQPAGLPTTVQWTASFSLENTSAQPNPVTFEVPSGGVVDLTTVMPATPEPGIVVVVSTVDRERAEAARDAAEGFAGDAETALTSTLAAAVYELRGTGQPGSTTETNNAPVGTYYTDTAGTAGAWRWLKTATGSGVSRWSVVHGDTRWRDVLSLLNAENWVGAATVPYLRIRRAGDRVTVAGRIKAVTGFPANRAILALPYGFRPRNAYILLGVALNGATLVPLGNAGNQYELAASVALSANADLAFEISFSTSDPFPTTLLGTPA